MSLRITIQVTCDTPQDAMEAMARLTRPKTWQDHLGVVSDSRIDQIMGGSAKGAEQALGESGAKDAPRPNVSPGESGIGKIGSKTKSTLLLTVKDGRPIPPAWAEHMKLLWSRGEVKYDGKEYYL